MSTELEMGIGQHTEEDDIDRVEVMKGCLAEIDKQWTRFSVAAYEYYHSEDWKTAGYADFKAFGKEQLGMEYRSLMWRVKVGETIVHHNLTMDEIGQMGWTKFATVMPLIKKDMKRSDLQKLLKKARTSTVADLKDYVRTVQTKSEVTQKKVRLNFTLLNEQDTVVQEALKDCMAKAQSENPGVGLEYMAITYLMHIGGEMTAEAVEAAREKLSKVEEPKVKPKRMTRSDKGKKKGATTAKKAPRKASTAKKGTNGAGTRKKATQAKAAPKKRATRAASTAKKATTPRKRTSTGRRGMIKG